MNLGTILQQNRSNFEATVLATLHAICSTLTWPRLQPRRFDSGNGRPRERMQSEWIVKAVGNRPERTLVPLNAKEQNEVVG
jgi:hypothetical protein